MIRRIIMVVVTLAEVYGMSIWTTSIKLRNSACRTVVALITGFVVTLLTHWFLFPEFFYWIGWPPSIPGWLFLLIYIGTKYFIPMYVMLWLLWEITPGSKASTWARMARLIAATSGTVMEVALNVLIDLLDGSQLRSTRATDLMFLAALFGSSGAAAIWLFKQMRPGHAYSLIWRPKRQRRVEAGLCGSCGYNLTGNVSGVCPECGTATSSTTSSAKRATSPSPCRAYRN